MTDFAHQQMEDSNGEFVCLRCYHRNGVGDACHEYASNETAYGRTVGYDFAIKVF